VAACSSGCLIRVGLRLMYQARKPLDDKDRVALGQFQCLARSAAGENFDVVVA